MILKVIDQRWETRNTCSLILEKPKDFSFYPGQYLDVELLVHPEQSRAFTIASSPTEDFLMITFKKGISVFKKKMASLKKGATIKVSHPAGTFTLDENSAAVFIAGGVGITPFRSIIKYILDQKISTPMSLIYFNSDDQFLFKKEFSLWQKNYPKLSIIYHNTKKIGRLYLDSRFLSPTLHSFSSLRSRSRLAGAFGGAQVGGVGGDGAILDSIFYLAGPPKMVDDFEKILLDSGVDQTNIRYDRFDGY